MSTPGSQHYCLRWNNYQHNLTSVFDQLLQNEAFVDVTLAVSGRTLKAHKMMLSACSPYFQSLLSENPCKHPIIIIKDVSFADMQAVIQFMYKGEINVVQEQLPSLLKLAETLKVRGLADVPEGQTVTRRLTAASPEGGAQTSPAPRVPSSPSPRGKCTPVPVPTSPAAGPDKGDQQEGGPPPPPPRVPPSPAGARPPPATPGASDDTEIRPAIAEMIKEEERAKLLESAASWNTPQETTFQHQLQQAWQKSWNQQQSLLQNLRFRERGPLKSWRPETMADAIMSVLREGHSLSQAARKYDIPYPTFVLYANRVHNLLGPSQDGPGGMLNNLRPKGRGRPQRILLGSWPEDTVKNVIRAVVFRDTSGLKDQMEEQAAAAAAGNFSRDPSSNFSRDPSGNYGRDPSGNYSRDPSGNYSRDPSGSFGRTEAAASVSKMPMPHLNGRPPYQMAGASASVPPPVRGRPPSLLGFPDLHMMMGMFPPGMMSTTGAVPTINLPRPPADLRMPGPRGSPPPSSRPVPALSSINGPLARPPTTDSPLLSRAPTSESLLPSRPPTTGSPLLPRPSVTDSPLAASERSSGDEPCPLEPLQEMTEGEEALDIRRRDGEGLDIPPEAVYSQQHETSLFPARSDFPQTGGSEFLRPKEEQTEGESGYPSHGGGHFVQDFPPHPQGTASSGCFLQDDQPMEESGDGSLVIDHQSDSPSQPGVSHMPAESPTLQALP